MKYSECDELENNLRYWRDPPSWLRGCLMLLRYEDLANNPLLITHNVYNYLGLKVPESVKTWLEYNTHWKQPGAFSRARVSHDTVHVWRSQIEYKMMADVQRRCITPLTMAGYTLISSKKDFD